jgi:hypothetical protein
VPRLWSKRDGTTATEEQSNRCFDELSGPIAGVNPLLLRIMDEVIVAASRAGYVVVAPKQILLDGRGGKTPHMTVAPCFTPIGESTPPLLVFPRPKRVLKDLDAMHQRSLFGESSSKGWVERRVYREWCQWSAEWNVQRRIALGMHPEEPAVLVPDNAPTSGDLAALQFLAEKHIIVVTLPPRLTHVMQPFDV